MIILISDLVFIIMYKSGGQFNVRDKKKADGHTRIVIKKLINFKL